MTPVILSAVLLAPLQPPAAPVVAAAKPAELPAATEVRAKPGRACRLTADTPGKAVRWELADPAAADLIPADDGRTATFVAPAAGRHLVLAYTAAGDSPSPACRVVVVVGDPAPEVPPAPRPVDPLTARVRDLYAADHGPGKAGQLADLAALYTAAVELARKSDLTTVAQVAAQVAAAAKTPPLSITGLVEVRRAVAAELQAAFGNPDEVLTDASRAKLAATFQRIAVALTEAGK